MKEFTHVVQYWYGTGAILLPLILNELSSFPHALSYGQSALHIAARKGSVRMLRLLIGAGGGTALRIADCAGETPMDVAVKHSHTAAMMEFSRTVIS